MFEKSIKFLLENAGTVIKYRLHKELLHDLSETNENKLLKEVYKTPHFQLLKTYIKTNGYIGIGMHSWDKFKETPLQDGETAARLLSCYSIPKTNPIIKNFIHALRNDDVLRKEFSYYKPEIARFTNRFLGLRNGGGLMVLIYTMQALLGYGDDDEVKEFQNISIEAFKSILQFNSLDEITKINKNLSKKYNYPYIEEDTYFPCSYHLTILAYTHSWRTKKNISVMIDAINYLSKIILDEYNMHIKINSNYYCPLWALTRPLKAFSLELLPNNYVMYRRVLTEIAMLGVGGKVNVIKDSIDSIKEALSKDGIIHVKFNSSYQKQRYLKMLEYTTAYSEVGLEENYKKETALECDLTF
ncbi:MAG: hypothetical protein LBC76_11585 [Treponema sp.]|jgi:hypothetical protein|nr:hypothetical protein [Treponema sp.]